MSQNILLFYPHHEWTVGHSFRRGLLAQGCDVRTAGPSTRYYGVNADIPTGPRPWLPEVLRQIAPWSPDLIITVDTGGPILNGLAGFAGPKLLYVADPYFSPATYHYLRFVARSYDRLYVSQRHSADELVQKGVDAEWMPFAFDDQLHRPETFKMRRTAFVADVCFSGNVSRLYGARAELIGKLRDVCRVEVRSTPPSELGALFATAPIGFNRSLGKELNQRVFEATGFGTVLLTDRLPEDRGLDELLHDSTQMVRYEGPADCVERARELASDVDRCESIANAAQRLVLSKHTYQHRCATMLKFAETCVPGYRSGIRGAVGERVTTCAARLYQSRLSAVVNRVSKRSSMLGHHVEPNQGVRSP
jgi:hypothetical protein